MTTTFGDELRRWRNHRRFSQLALATAAEVSQRHLSFLETGKAKPSREMVLHLARVLDLPLRRRNELLIAAGFAPIYPQTALDAPAMRQIDRILDFVLGAHEPYPTIVVDRRWDVVRTNAAAAALLSPLLTSGSVPMDRPPNIARLTFHPGGLRTVTANWEHVASSGIHRLERELAERAGDPSLRELYEEVLGYPDVADLRRTSPVPTGADLLVPVHYRTPDLELRLFTTIATIGAPHDITLEELRLETFYPADTASQKVLESLQSS